MERERVYKERANGKFEYYTYSEGQRVYLSESWVKKHMHQLRIVRVYEYLNKKKG